MERLLVRSTFDMGYSSLLERRSLDSHDLEPLRAPTRVRANSSSSTRHARRPQPSALLFRPLTPILSPSLTTSPSSDGFSSGLDSDLNPDSDSADYLTRGRLPPPVHTPATARLWTSTPPTPPHHSPQNSLSDTRPHVRPSDRPLSVASFPSPPPDVRPRRRASTLSHVRTSRSPSPITPDDLLQSAPPPPERTRRPPMFHIPSYVTDDDLPGPHSDDGGRGDDDDGEDDSTSPHDSEEDRLARDAEKARVRKYHALMELLDTELGYLQDLRTLVTVSSPPYTRADANLRPDIPPAAPVCPCALRLPRSRRPHLWSYHPAYSPFTFKLGHPASRSSDSLGEQFRPCPALRS